MQRQEEQRKTVLQRLAALPSRNMKDAPSFGAQLKALWREGLKDLNDTIQRAFFGQQAGIGEPGTPLVPTQAMVTSDLGVAYARHSRMEDGAQMTSAQTSYHDKLAEAASQGAAARQQQKGLER